MLQNILEKGGLDLPAGMTLKEFIGFQHGRMVAPVVLSLGRTKVLARRIDSHRGPRGTERSLVQYMFATLPLSGKLRGLGG